MFRIFKKKEWKPSVLHPILLRVGQAIDKTQRRCADYLTEKVKSWSRSRIKIALVIFCLIQGGASSYILVSVFRPSRARINVEKVSIPSHIIQKDTSGRDEKEPVLSEKSYQRLKAFQSYMDSLQRDQAGRQIYDSILRVRPGLLDSITQIESIYQQQIRR